MTYAMIGMGVIFIIIGILTSIVGAMAGHPTELLEPAVVMAVSGGAVIGTALGVKI